MSYPLQPSLTPAPRWLRNLLISCLAVCAVLTLGLTAGGQARPPQLLLTTENDHSYFTLTRDLFARAESRIWVMLYVCHPETSGRGPTHDLCRALGDAKARGVDVRVVLDHGKRWGEDEIDPKHEKARDLLTGFGVPVILDELDRTTHVKALLIDDDHLVIGSHNWTYSALKRNREASLLARDASLAGQIADVFLAIPGFAAAGN